MGAWLGILQDGFQKYTVGNHVNDLGIHYNLEMMSVQTKEMRHHICSAVARGQLSVSVQLARSLQRWIGELMEVAQVLSEVPD